MSGSYDLVAAAGGSSLAIGFSHKIMQGTAQLNGENFELITDLSRKWAAIGAVSIRLGC